jgi:precorrin-3B C17-methyltransferase
MVRGMGSKVFIIGIGPGSRESMSLQAISALDRAEVLIGHRSCLDLIRDLTSQKETISTRMSPIERSQLAASLCLAGKDVALVCSGDPGIYAIASTFLGYLKEVNLKISVEIIPGITVANAAAAILGAPLGRDFATISLADRATPWSEIERRLITATQADFVVVLYNPRGRMGEKRLSDTISRLQTLRRSDTPVGIVTNATRCDETACLTPLGEISASQVSEESVVIVGNSATFIFNSKMITPRAYKDGVGY